MIEALRSALADVRLAERPVDEVQKLAKRLRRKHPELLDEAPRRLRLALLGSFTTSYLEELLPLFLLARGIAVELYACPYGGMMSDLLGPESGYRRFDAELTVLLPTHRDLDALGGDVARAVGDWQGIWRRIDGPVVQLSLDPPPLRPLAEADGLMAGGLTRAVREANLALADAAPEQVGFVDMEALAQRLGDALFHDARMYDLAKQPYAMEALPHLADAIAAAVTARAGRARKALVLDLDNTCWGGIIGDDGLEGIVIGSETAEGESFRRFQAYAKSLKERGIVLAVCSKNHDHIARSAFEQHSGMVLRLDDIACFVANFEDKASNIRKIAKTLNLGLDALVFVDDNPVECDWVRSALPEVAVLHLEGDPSGFAGLLDRANLFPVTRVTGEDRKRAESYKAMREVAEGLDDAEGMEGFLEGLAPVATSEGLRPDTSTRLVQLLAKTNQFKLNPQAFTAEELAVEGRQVIALRLSDRLQDYGIVAVAVLDREAEALVIRNWVMSCRVFSRRLEFRTWRLIVDVAAAAGLDRIRLSYIASGRNGLVGELLPKLGFAPRSDLGEDVQEAEAKVGETIPEDYMSVELAIETDTR